MYEEMLARMKDQLILTQTLLDGFRAIYKTAKSQNNSAKQAQSQRDVDFEQGYLKGIEAGLTILESYYDKIS